MVRHLLVNKVATLGGGFQPLAPDAGAVHQLLDEAGSIGISAMRHRFGPERLEPRPGPHAALHYWTFTLPVAGGRLPTALLRVTLADDVERATWEYQKDQQEALVLAGLVAARILHR
jgi:hypothetical protein